MRKFRCVIIFYRRLEEAHRIKWKRQSTLLGVDTLYGQMAEVYLLSWTFLCVIGVSGCFVSFLHLPAVRRTASGEGKMYSLPPFFRLILTFSYCLYDFLRELGTGRSPDTDKADSFHGHIRWAKLNDFAPDIQDAMELWALRPHVILVKVISVCGLHIFFHQYVVDLRERKSENVFRTVSSSPLVFNMTLLRTSRGNCDVAGSCCWRNSASDHCGQHNR